VLKVAIDARRLQDRPLFGVGRGLANVIPHLSSAVDLVLLCDRRRPMPPAGDWRMVALPGFGPLPEIAWMQLGVPWWLNRRRVVYHGPYNAVPFASRGRRVVTIHDLSWEHHPEDLTTARRLALIAQARWSVRHADVVVTVSEFVRDRIAETYKISAERLVVAPNAVDPSFHPGRASDAGATLRPWGVGPPYVVALGGAPRRGLATAIEAWGLATSGLDPRPSLVVVGSESFPPREGVVFVGRLDDRAWSAILAGAAAFCYPTRYEGFGMPALEAAASGVPVVCAPVAALPEVLGPAAEWADSTDADDVAAALIRVLSSDDRRSWLRAAGLERAASSPSWGDVAAVLLETYHRVAA
jgi:glycosyltransferase involved in cell wall biosynthesis